MVHLNKVNHRAGSTEIGSLEICCDAGDTKPVGTLDDYVIPQGSTLLELDAAAGTAKVYVYSADTAAWVEV